MDDSSSSLSYTVGFSIAIAAISFFALFQICRFLVREILKWLAESNENRVVRCEKQKRNLSGRKLSTATIKKLQNSIEKDTSLSKVNRVEFHVESERKFEKIHQSMRKKSRNDEQLTFFAGYSHKQFDDV